MISLQNKIGGLKSEFRRKNKRTTKKSKPFTGTACSKVKCIPTGNHKMGNRQGYS